jgi:dinuclear metal center YbgI/SA1388 family protein
MKIKEICELIEQVAPLSYQEDYDNAGLMIGNKETEVSKILLALDTTEKVIDEAIALKCNLIVAHHPIIFKGLKKINGKNEIEKVVIKAIKHDIAIYVAHTNLDNVLKHGVSTKFAQKLNLVNCKILAPKSNLLVKLNINVPNSHVEQIKNVLFENGAGQIGNYSECSFGVEGSATFKGGEGTNPFIGDSMKREHVSEIKLEFITPAHLVSSLLSKAKAAHPYEEMAYEIVPLSNELEEVGSGVIGDLPDEMTAEAFLGHLKISMNLEMIKFTNFDKPIKKVAVCGGSGSFLTSVAFRNQADVFVTADFKYHDFFDAENKLMLCDIGHFESEISTLEIFYEIITEKFINFAVIFCKTNTNPVKYFK